MKRHVRALVKVETAAVAGATALAVLCGATSAPAASPVVQLRGDAWLHGIASATTFRVDVGFTTDTPGADLFTVQQAEMFFPDRAGTNGRLFPSCSARQIERWNGNVRRCPKGSQIGSGTVTASALQLGVTARGRVTMFNGHRGRSVTVNVQTLLPAYVNESLDAPITQLHGRYGEKLTLVVPHSLQEILSGVYVGVRRFRVTIGGVVVRNGVRHPFLKARTCPRLPMRGVFDFKDWTSGQAVSVTTDAKVRCTLR